MSADRQPQKSSRGWIFLMARWAAALLILGILFYLLPAAPLRNALSRVPLTRFLAVLLIYLVALTGGIAKWHTVVNSAGAQLSFAASAQCYTSGLFGALFLPSIIGGDVARLAVGISRGRHPAAVITGNVADRFLDVAAQLTLVSLGLMLLPGSPQERPTQCHNETEKNRRAKSAGKERALRRPLQGNGQGTRKQHQAQRDERELSGHIEKTVRHISGDHRGRMPTARNADGEARDVAADYRRQKERAE